MAGKGTGIIVTAEPKGTFLEGFVSGTPKPGTIMQVVAATEPVGGRFTWQAFDKLGDGALSLIAVLLPDELQGKLNSDAYASGDRCYLYCPLPGEELNVLKQDVAGTGDDFAIGDLLIVDDGTGKVIATTGSPESQPFVCMETITDPTADVLVHVMFTGY
jgi:hypothetical protein